MVRTAILTVSDKGAAGEREDGSAQAIRQVLKNGPFVEVDYQVVPDEQALIGPSYGCGRTPRASTWC